MTTSTPAKGFVCDRCSHCCRAHRVPVTITDTRRLATTHLLKASRFVELLDPATIGMTDEPESIFRTSEGPRVLVLRLKGEACIFLDKSGCSIHASRPRACRSYPYDRPAQGETGLGLHPAPLCPEETGFRLPVVAPLPPSLAAERLERTEELKERDQELRRFAEQVGRWNKKQKLRLRLGRVPRSSQELLDWLDPRETSP